MDFMCSWKKLEEQKKVKTSLAEKASSSVLEYPYSVTQLTKNCLKKSKLHLPRKFAREKGLCGRCCSIILKDGEGNCWPAKLLYKSSAGKAYITGGWTSFRVAHKLKTGDLLIFELTRNGKIPILRMRRLQEYPEVKQEIMNQNNAEVDSSSPGHLLAATEASNLEKSQLHIPEGGAEKSGCWKKAKTRIEAKASSSALQRPICVIELIRDSFRSSTVYLPRRFAKEHGLYGRCCSMILMDGEGNSWPAELIYRSSNGKMHVGGGWKSFSLAHKLKIGDSLLVELLRNGTIPVLEMRRVQEHPEVKQEVIDQNNAETNSPSPGQFHATTEASNLEKSHLKIPERVVPQCFFVAKIYDSWFDSKLYIPGKFAWMHFRNNTYCKLILIDREGRSWLANLHHNDSDELAYIGDGWNEFRIANNLKPGDSFVFEFIKKGKTPVFKMCEFKTNQKAGTNEETTSSSIEKTCFYVIVKSSYVRNGQIRIPADFARRNGLATDICSEMTMKNEIGNSWPVKTKVYKKGEVFIQDGWSEFADENGIKEGDVFMLELVNEEGKKPLMNYYASK